MEEDICRQLLGGSLLLGEGDRRIFDWARL